MELHQNFAGIDIRGEIERLRKEKNAIILAHYYQKPELQDIADFVGDSLDLSRKAAATEADVIAFCGVRFMAETAKILSPDKIVVLPDMDAGCSLEDSCPPEQFAAFRAKHPDHIALTYINCSAEVKALSDVIVTSSSAEAILAKIPLDQKITASDSKEAHKVISILSAFTTTSKEVPEWSPRVVAEKASIGGLGPVGVGSPATVADEMERWIEEGDLDGFNLAYVTTPGTFEDIVDLLIPELRRRGLYPEKVEDGLTAREKVYGKGQSQLRDDHTGSRYRYDVYKEEAPYQHPEKKPSDQQAPDVAKVDASAARHEAVAAAIAADSTAEELHARLQIVPSV